MEPRDVPDAMVEAAARALHEHDDDPEWDALDEYDRQSYRDAQRFALAAALSVCEAEEERGQILLHGFVAGQFWSGSNMRRWVFTTPAEPVPDGETT